MRTKSKGGKTNTNLITAHQAAKNRQVDTPAMMNIMHILEVQEDMGLPVSDPRVQRALHIMQRTFA